MNGRRWLIFMAVLLLVLAASACWAADTPSPPSTDTVKKIDMSDAAGRSMSRALTAYSLITFGRQNKSPEALITAAQILTSVQPREWDAKMEKRPKDATDSTSAKEISVTPADVKSLLAEAKTMSSNDANITALADKVGQSTSSSINRTQTARVRANCDTLSAGGTDVYSAAYKKGDNASVAVRGDGGGQLRLCVADSQGNPVATCDQCKLTDCTSSWTAPSDDNYKISVTNLSDQSIDYCIAAQ